MEHTGAPPPDADEGVELAPHRIPSENPDDLPFPYKDLYRGQKRLIRDRVWMQCFVALLVIVQIMTAMGILFVVSQLHTMELDLKTLLAHASPSPSPHTRGGGFPM